MNSNKQYSYIKFAGGICGLTGGGIGIVLGLRGEMAFLVLGLISLVMGISLFYGMSKK